MLQWIMVFKSLFKFLLSIFLDIFPEVELLDHMVILFLSFWGITLLFSIAVTLYYIPSTSIQVYSIQVYTSIQVLISLYILTTIFYFL